MSKKQISVYIVEDYLLYRLTLKNSLQQLGFNVLNIFETAEACIETLKKNVAPDVVLMDLGLPKTNGLEATKIIKSINDNIKVIAITSHESEDEVLASLSAGVNAYCLKEISIERLATVIELVNDGALCLDPKVAHFAYKYFPKPIMFSDINNLYEKPEDFPDLTERERMILKLLSDGKSNTVIAKDLSISPHTVKSYVRKILEKFSVSDRVQAAVKAVKYKII